MSSNRRQLAVFCTFSVLFFVTGCNSQSPTTQIQPASPKGSKTPPPTAQSQPGLPKDSETPQPDREAQLFQFVAEQPHLGELPDGVTDGGQKTAEVNGATVSTTPFKETLTVEELAAFNPNQGILWPGSLVQGSSLPKGHLAAIPVRRMPLTLTLSTLVERDQHRKVISRTGMTVEKPSAKTVDEARKELLKQGFISPAKFSYTLKQFYSLDQALMQFGARASWAGGRLGADINSSRYEKKTNIIIRFVQEYYTLASDPPSSPTAYFDPRVTIDQLRPYSGPANPIAYVQSVTYGRMAMLVISSKESLESLRTAINAGVSYLGGSADAKYKGVNEKVLRESEMQLLVIGGSPDGALAIAKGPEEALPQLQKWIAESQEVAAANSKERANKIEYGLPISYRVNYLKDNQIARLSFTTDYNRVEVVPIPQLVEWTITFVTTDDDKNDDTGLIVQIYQPNGPTYASYVQRGKKKYDNSSTHTEVLDLHVPLFVRDVGKARLKIAISPKGSDSWEFQYKLTARNPANNATYVQTGSRKLREKDREENVALHPAQ